MYIGFFVGGGLDFWENLYDLIYIVKFQNISFGYFGKKYYFLDICRKFFRIRSFYVYDGYCGYIGIVFVFVKFFKNVRYNYNNFYIYYII